MDATTLERVKRLLPGSTKTTEEDAYLADLITTVSDSIEQWLRRKLLVASRTITIDWREGRRRLWLSAFPISASPELELYYDPGREFAAASLIDPENYALDLDNGTIYFDRWSPPEGWQELRIIWTGGMAATTAALATAYPSVVHAATLQVVHEFRRRRRLDVSSMSIGGQSFSVASDLGMLKRVEELLQPHRREAVNS